MVRVGRRHGAHAAQVAVATWQRLRRGVAVAATAATVATDQGRVVTSRRGRGAYRRAAPAAALRGAGELHGPGAS